MIRNIHTIWRPCLFAGLFCAMAAVSFAQDYQLPRQPLADDGGYIVQWDCTANGGKGGFAPANTMEWDETFVFAVNLGGTKLGEWLMGDAANAGMVRLVCCDAFRTKFDMSTQFKDAGARLWHLRDTIFGAVYNFSQRSYQQGQAAGSWRPQTGDATPIAFRLFGAENGFWGKCGANGDVDPAIVGKNGKWWQWTEAGWNNVGAYIIPKSQQSLSPDKQFTFRFARYTGTKTDSSPVVTDDETDKRDLYYDKDHAVSTTGYASPFGKYSPCPIVYPVDYQISVTNAAICPDEGEVATVSLSGSQDGYSYTLWRDGTPVASSETAGTGNPLTWTADRPGTYEVYAFQDGSGVPLLMKPCGGVSSVLVSKRTDCVSCPVFEWAVDGVAGLGSSLYPGGWYDISCTTDAGAPALSAVGTGVTVVRTATNGKTTTIRIELDGNAAGDITLSAHSPANTAGNYKACDETMSVPVSPCDGMTRDTWKVEWYNYNGDNPFPQYWIQNGAPVYLRDNSGRIEADIAHTDGQDEWFFLPTGKQKAGQPTCYIRNGLTKRYLYRGSQHGNVGTDWEYAEALLSTDNKQTEDYEWLFYDHNGLTAFVCAADFNGSNISNGAYVLHVRLWEAPDLFSNPRVSKPGMVCGKMADQDGSPVFYMKSKSHPATSAVSLSTVLGWTGTAPADTVSLRKGSTQTYMAKRTDAVHSVNRQITYTSSDPAVATVDANGKITAVGKGKTTITVTLESVGCFDGDVLAYVVRVIECGDIPVLTADAAEIYVDGTCTVVLTNPASSDEETAAYEWTPSTGFTFDPTTGVFTGSKEGEYKLVYKITNAGYPECNRNSNTLTVKVKEPKDYRLPNQPVAADGTYIVKWDCAAGDFAASNDMEWGETFTLAVDLTGTPLGEWIKQGPSRPDLVRSVAFDRFIYVPDGNYNDATDHFNLDASRLWHIRDNIYGATYNFSQIPFQSGNSLSVKTGDAPKIAIRLFGFETAMGTRCPGDEKRINGNWWEWSDAGNCRQDWNGKEWKQNTYVSNNDKYMFSFAPSTGKKDAAVNTRTDDDPRDQWYDAGHYFDRPGYASPCPKAWPVKQTLSVSPAEICVEKGEMATITLSGAELGWTYIVQINGAEDPSVVHTVTGNAGDGYLSWTVSAPGTYTVYAQADDGTQAHSDYMGACGGVQQVVVKAKDDCEDKCPQTQYSGETVTRCQADAPYLWRGQTIAKPGTYYDTVFSTLPNGMRCEAEIHTLTYTLTEVNFHPEETVERCDTLGAYTWRNRSFSQSGTYRDTVWTSATEGKCPTEVYTLSLQVIHCEREPEPCVNDIHRKWNDLLFVDNSSDLYVAYRWYRDGQPLDGETRQYYYVEGQILSGDGHTYHCVMTTADGRKVTACAGLFDAFGASVSDQSSTGTMTLSPQWTHSGVEVSIRGIVPEHGIIYSSAGQQVMDINGASFVAQLPAGCYLVRVKDTDGMVHCDKLIVR